MRLDIPKTKRHAKLANIRMIAGEPEVVLSVSASHVPTIPSNIPTSKTSRYALFGVKSTSPVLYSLDKSTRFDSTSKQYLFIGILIELVYLKVVTNDKPKQ